MNIIYEYNNKNKRLNVDKLSQDELNLIKNTVKNHKIVYITGTCSNCSKPFDSQININSDISKIKLCKKCKTIKTNLERYGCEYSSQNKEVFNKIRKTNEERYGGFTLASKKLSKKQKKTCKERYGSENVFNLQEFQEKAKESLLKNYNVDNIFKEPNIKTQIKQKLEEKYGGMGFGSDIIKNKIEDTCLERYNNKHYRNPDKMLKTRLEKYGVISFFAIYKYNNQMFDSSWELAFYIYHKDKGHDIIREPIQFEYDYNKQKHLYTPDFKIGNKYYEIKGEQFIERYKNGKIKSFRSPYKTDNQMQYKALYKCVKMHKVIIITYLELYPMFSYIEKTYGADYLKQFKV